MKLQFKPSYGNIKTFFHNVTDIIEAVSVGRKGDPILEDCIFDITHIVFTYTGISMVNKENKDDKTIIEVNNFRALDVMLLIASESHELNDNQVLSGDTSYREIYQKEIRDRLDQMSLTDVSVVHSWYYEEDTMYDYVSFTIDSLILEKCMHEIHDYIKNM